MADRGPTPIEPTSIDHGPATPQPDEIPGSEGESPVPPPTGLGAGAKAGIVVGIVALVAALLFAGYMLVLRAKSPEQVTEDFFAALDQGDTLGVAANILPSERRFLIDPLIAGLEESQRLGVVASDIDLEAVQGFDLGFGDLTYEVATLADDLVWVAVSGEATFTGQVEDLPIGPLVQRYLPEDWAEELESNLETEAFGPDFGLALVKDDGKWFVSFTFTIAEAARREAGDPFPDEQPIPAPQGADTPERALELAVLAVVNLEVRDLVNVIAPGETAAFRRYAQLFIEDWDTAVADLRTGMEEVDFSYSVDEVVARSAIRGDATVAWIEDIPRFRAAIDAPDVGPISIDHDGDCTRILLPPSIVDSLAPALGKDIDFAQFDGRTCVATDDLTGGGTEEPFDPFAGQEDLLYGLPIGGPLAERWIGLAEDREGPFNVEFEVIEEDGRWFVSPAASMWRWFFAVTGTLDQGVLEEVGDDIRQSGDDPEAFEQRMEEWLVEVEEAGLADGLGPVPGEPFFGPELLAPYADQPNVLLVWDTDADFVVGRIFNSFGGDVVIGVIDGPDLYQLFEESFGPDPSVSPEDFPSGVLIAAVDIDTLVEIFNWPQILDMYGAAELGL